VADLERRRSQRLGPRREPRTPFDPARRHRDGRAERRSPVLGSFRNFHDSYSSAKDYKIRFAFKETPYYGAYMTDIIKGVAEVSSKKLLRYLKANPSVLQDNIGLFQAEMTDLGSVRPTILVFGGDAHALAGRASRYAPIHVSSC
jgi:hypothetical protein